jgi:hypothetical protein
MRALHTFNFLRFNRHKLAEFYTPHDYLYFCSNPYWFGCPIMFTAAPVSVLPAEEKPDDSLSHNLPAQV